MDGEGQLFVGLLRLVFVCLVLVPLLLGYILFLLLGLVQFVSLEVGARLLGRV